MIPNSPSKPDALTVSVIVTNYNYGHYLTACLNSLQSQTVPPDEIIVVDDGSTDGSSEVLSGFDDVTVITQHNGGQAAAFNTGFAASTGKIVIFVDADDKLRPTAVEVIRRLWSRDISALSFSLGMIDGDGRSIGQYLMDLPDADLLPRLLGHLAIPFMPTSGNAFQRSAIEWAFPLPAERWRISTDALLIRVAVLAAPVRHVRQVLGDYRVHGQNNYFRAGASGSWKANRGLRDIAETGLDLIWLADRAQRPVSRRDRAKLLTAAIRARLKAEALMPDPGLLAQFQSRVLQHCNFRDDPRLYGTLLLSLWALRHNSRLREWTIDPRQCPRVFLVLFRTLRGRNLSNDLAEIVEPRAPFDSRLSPDSAPPDHLMDWLTSPEWVLDHGTGGADLCGATGRLILRRSWAGPAKITVSVVPCPGTLIRIAVFQAGLPLGTFEINSALNLEVVLPESNSFPPPADLIEFRVIDEDSDLFGVWSRLLRKAHRLRVTALRVEPLPPQHASAVLGITSLSSFGEIGSVVLSANETAMDGALAIGSGEKLSLAVPPLKSPFCLVMRLAETQTDGYMTICVEGIVVFSANVSGGQECLVKMPDALSLLMGPVELEFGFRPTDFLEEGVVTILNLGWLPHDAEGRYGLPLLSPGAWAGPGTGRTLEPFLGEGWMRLNDGAAAMLGPVARLVLSQGAVVRDAALRLDLEPMDPMRAQDNLIIIVNVNGAQRAAVQLVKQAIIEIPMDGVLSDPSHKIEAEIYAATRPGDGAETHDHGGIQLNGLGILAPPPQVLLADMEESEPNADTACARLLLDLRAALDRGVSQAKLEQMRDDLCQAISRTSPTAIGSILSAANLNDLCRLSVKLLTPPGDAGFSALTDSGWLKSMAMNILSGPAFRTMPDIALTELPETTPDFAAAIGAYLVADPAAGTGRDELLAYQDHVVNMLQQARAVLASHPENSPLSKLSTAIVTEFRARQLLFSDLALRPHVEAFGQALEATLLRQGYDLFAPQSRPAATKRGKQRIGILLHNTALSPETWIWRAMLKSIPADRAEITLFLTEQNDPPNAGFDGMRVVGLAGKSLAATVAAIRLEQMDVMILGSFFYGYGFMTTVCAHRLAPRQIAMSAAFPATTGLSSVDEFLLGKTVAPKAVAADYTEKVVWAPGTGQKFDIEPTLPGGVDVRATTRLRFGIDVNDVMLVSGAMQDKIGADVLAVWTQILTHQPAAVLVLYPFATNWQQNFDEPAFSARVARACTASGVDPQRVRILPPIPKHEVDLVLLAADIYLDSFPYSGATTTVEALQCGVPVVALRGQTQRGHQAAGWLAAFGLKKLVAASHRAYVKIAVDLAASIDACMDAECQIDAGRATAMEQEQFTDWFAAHLLSNAPAVNAAPRYLFHHMPKTGGTSLKRVFGSWFDLVEDYREPWALAMPTKLNLESLGPQHMLCGHFAADTSPLAERYPETCDPENWCRIAFVRSPLECAISNHAFEKKLRATYDPTFSAKPLGEYLRKTQGLFLQHFECTEADWRAALERYWFIGTLERLPECLNYLSAELDKPVPQYLPHDNLTARDEVASQEDIAAFMQNNAIEFEIYDEIAAKLDHLLREHSGD